MIKALHVFKTYFPNSYGGIEEVIRQTCLSTAPLGVQSRIFALGDHPTAVVSRDEGDVYRARQSFEIASCGFSFTAKRQFDRLIAWADVIHYHFPWPFADLLHLASRIEKPSLLVYHSDIVRQRLLLRLYQPVMYAFLDSVSRIICTSPNYLETSEHLKNFSEKTHVVPIGIDEATYPCIGQIDVDSARRTFGEGFFLFVGVLRYYKGLHILLDACVNASFRVVIVGAGPTEESLKRQAHRLGLTNVTFAGRVPDATKVALFRLCKAVVFPSHLRSEAFGVALLEGAMFGKPLISAEAGSGTSYVNIHGETGLVVEAGNPHALRAAMDCLQQNRHICDEYGCSARRRYLQLFTASLMARRYVSHYADLLGAKESNDCTNCR